VAALDLSKTKQGASRYTVACVCVAVKDISYMLLPFYTFSDMIFSFLITSVLPYVLFRKRISFAWSQLSSLPCHIQVSLPQAYSKLDGNKSMKHCLQGLCTYFLVQGFLNVATERRLMIPFILCFNFSLKFAYFQYYCFQT
jgi:hypothetical protein